MSEPEANGLPGPMFQPGSEQLALIDEGFCIIEVIFDEGKAVDYRFLEANAAFERQTGLVGAIGKRMLELEPLQEQSWIDTYGRIARTGKPERFELPAQALGSSYDVFAFRVGEPEQRRIAILFNDISVRKRAELALKESEERQAFLLKLSDELGPLADPKEIKSVATRLIGEQLGVNRVFYADAAEGHWLVAKGYERDIPPLPDLPFEMADYGKWIIRDFRLGRRLVVDDMSSDARFDEAERRAHLSLQIGAEAALPLVKGGELRAMMVVHTAAPRDWSERDLALLEETADRTWAAAERARAEEALRLNEARLRGVLQSMSDGVFIGDRHGITLANQAALEQLGYDNSEQLNRDIGTLALAIRTRDYDSGKPISADDHPFARALDGENVVRDVIIEHRKSGQERVVRSAASPVMLNDDIVAAVAVNTDITDTKRNEEALRQSERHAQTLLAELQHRVRNTLAVVRSIARRTAETSGSKEDMLAHFVGRLDAFSRVQSALTRSPNARIDLATLIEDELIAHATREGTQVHISGPAVSLETKTAERLSLAFHELTTNAVKHGALINGGGKVRIRWQRKRTNGSERLLLEWIESGVDTDFAHIDREGFGMELLKRSLPYELGAETRVDFSPTGLRFELRLPLSSKHLEMTEVKA